MINNKEVLITAKTITTKSGHEFIVDDQDLGLVNKVTWVVSKSKNTVYARGRYCGKMVFMHRLIMNPPDNMDIDHIDGNGSNNQRYNLRVCSKSQNAQNINKKQGTSSQFKGVRWAKGENKWKVGFRFEGKYVYVGGFLNEYDAAEAYNKAVTEKCGEFARVNDV